MKCLRPRWARLWTLIALLCVVLDACACAGRPEHVVTLADDRATVTIPVGARLVVLLDANPEQDHLWIVDELDQNILRFDKKTLVELDKESVFGGNRFRKFEFTALQQGQTRLELDFSSLRLDDEDETDDLETYMLKVVVTE